MEFKDTSRNHTCGLGGQVDNVNEPSYNMRNVIRQIILLEEHLAEDNKYCKACCVKHFNHILGLIEEAKWMACSSPENTYPLMNESFNLFNSLFILWARNMNDSKIRKHVLSNMRNMRQSLIDQYYFNLTV